MIEIETGTQVYSNKKGKIVRVITKSGNSLYIVLDKKDQNRHQTENYTEAIDFLQDLCVNH